MPQTQRINPANGEVLGPIAFHTPAQIEDRLQRARKAFNAWRDVPIEARADQIGKVASVLRSRREMLSKIMVTEMGKPITAAETEVDKCADTCDYFSKHGPKLLAPVPVLSDAEASFIRFDPLGAVLAIMPWNFPLWQVVRFAAPALIAGNVGLLKHAPNVPECAAGLEDVFLAAGLPEGVFQHLKMDEAATERAIAHPVVAAVTLTGSGRAGRAVAAAAGAALKKTVLELGGSDPFIVLPDADIAAVAKPAASARTINSGQSCIAAKRFIVVGDTERFANAFVGAMGALKVGDPMDRETQIGPLARHDLLENLHRQVEQSVRQGARLLLGGKPINRPGYFYPPTVLDNVRPGMTVFDEETFGPVAAVVRASDVDEAIELANRTPYGLAANLWTRDVDAALPLAARIDAGSVFINGIVKSDARLPFGGIKESGWGRELGSEGIREFTNIKTVWASRPG